MVLENPEPLPLHSYFLLPLLGFDWKLFGTFLERITISDNFKWLHIHALNGLHPDICGLNNVSVLMDELCYRIYRVVIPNKFCNDVKLFTEGKYSMMSEEAKKVIELRSGLQFNEPFRQYEITHVLLLGLRSSILLKNLFTETNGEYIKMDSSGTSIVTGGYIEGLQQLGRDKLVGDTDPEYRVVESYGVSPSTS